mmetsp:Transcript_22027/g.64967  ORF Transcript_22027/g.64967 Transcript_22027/m.64967 type:complete len:125 (+) Transcript_22027:291-665(+)
MVSIGNEMKINKFLELNPEVPRDLLYGDDSADFSAYNTAGFGRIGEVTPPTKLSAPKGVPWLKYMANVAALSPMDNVKFGEIPEGVTRLGGTFVIEGDKVTYGWSDAVPGDEPPIEDVVRAAGA